MHHATDGARMPMCTALRGRHLLLIEETCNLPIAPPLRAKCKDAVSYYCTRSRFAESRIAKYHATQPDLSQCIPCSRCNDFAFKFIDRTHDIGKQSASGGGSIHP